MITNLQKLVLLTSLFLFLLIISTQAEDFEVAFVTEATAAGKAHEVSVVLDGGYTDGIVEGMTGTLYKTRESKLSEEEMKKFKYGEVTVLDVSEYVSSCQVLYPGPDKITSCFMISIDIPDTSPESIFEDAMYFFAIQDYSRAKFLYTQVNELSPNESTEFIEEQINYCSEKLNKIKKQKLTEAEKLNEFIKYPLYFLLSLHFIYKGNYDAAELYLDKIFKVKEDNATALKIKKIIKDKRDYVPKRDDNEGNNKGDLDTLTGDKYPEMIYEEPPEYPIYAELNGITGLIQVTVLIDNQGEVLAAIIRESSGFEILDISALVAAYGNKFKPAIIQGKAVSCWVTYRVEFNLD